MTETLSHIALRRLNGPEASDSYYPLPNVKISLSAEGTLQIDAPEIHDGILTTNDLAEILPDGSFRILGRRDNVICSGGIKLQIEDIERKLSALGQPCQITAVQDARLGETVTLLYTNKNWTPEIWEKHCREILSPYEVPRHYLLTEQLPLTATGKPARAEARKLAAQLIL